MQIFNNEITVHRNETFTIDNYIVARDGAPYIVSKQWDNPYLLITVASSRYEQEGRYIRNWWLDLDKGFTVSGELYTLPRFNSTNPYKISNFNQLPDGFAADDVVFYTEDSLGNRTYKRYDVATSSFVNYEFRVVKSFTHEEVKDWVEQNYMYSIQLVAGNSVEDYLSQLCEDNDIDPTDKSVETMAEDLTAAEIDISDIDITKPLLDYSAVQMILKPTRLTVLSDSKGGM